MFSVVRDLGRLREITTVLIRHGFGEVVARLGIGRAETTGEDSARGEQERAAISTYERLRLVIEDLGPSFIKLGQILSTRADVLPPGLITELKKLQEQIPPIPSSDIRAAIEEGLGRPLTDVFLRFDDQPLASASIGQVHRAALPGPEGPVEVVVKVQRPGVAETVARDLDLLRRLAVALEKAVPETRLYSPTGLLDHFERSITTELNFTIEAEHAERFAHNFAATRGVRFPRVYREASARKVLTLEFFDGRKIDHALRDGFSGPRLARQSIGVVVKMIFEDGFFHADPHPGNILILGPPEEPVLGLIDLGMVGRLGPELRDRTIDLMVAAVRKDSYAVADALYAIGRPTGKVDRRAYRAEAALLAEKYLGRPLKEIELSAMIRDLIQGGIKYGIEIPPDFMLVGKALMTIEGIGRQLDPDLDVFGESAPYFLQLIKQRYSPRRVGNDLLRGIEQLSRAGFDLPMQAREVLDDLRLGRLSLQTPDPALPPAIDRAARRLHAAFIGAALLLSGALLLAGGRHEGIGRGLLLSAALWLLLHLLLERRG